jgi:hypothetical protein
MYIFYLLIIIVLDTLLFIMFKRFKPKICLCFHLCDLLRKRNIRFAVS